MILAIVLLGMVLIAAAAVAAIVSPAKMAVGLLGVGVFVSVAFVGVAITSSAGGSGPTGDVSHAQLEADRLMTQQMAIVVGPGMESQMTANAMLERSANDAYLRALEQHTYEVDRMLGRVP